jgi:hypothetical protein
MRFILCVLFWASLTFPIAKLFSQSNPLKPLQGKLGGTYASEFMVSVGVTYYGESITFKYSTDSFYYWHIKNGSGKGRYEIKGENLFLNFEMSDSLPKTYQIKHSLPIVKDFGTISIATHYDSVNIKRPLSGVTIEIINKLNKTVFLKSTGAKMVKIVASDFPITIRGYCLGYVPINFKLNEIKDYEVDLYFVDASKYKLNHGEKMEYIIGEFVREFICLRKKGDLDARSNKDKENKKFVFISYRRM